MLGKKYDVRRLKWDLFRRGSQPRRVGKFLAITYSWLEYTWGRISQARAKTWRSPGGYLRTRTGVGSRGKMADEDSPQLGES